MELFKLDSPLELRKGSSGEVVLRGICLKWGSRAQIPGPATEEFKAGSVDFSKDVILNISHDSSRPLCRYPNAGLSFVDGPVDLRMEAILPPTGDGRDVTTLIERGVMQNLSVEFVAKSENWEGSHRTITSAVLHGLAVVCVGAYSASQIELSKRTVVIPPSKTALNPRKFYL